MDPRVIGQKGHRFFFLPEKFCVYIFPNEIATDIYTRVHTQTSTQTYTHIQCESSFLRYIL